MNRKRISIFCTVLLMLASLCLLFYPFFSNYLFEHRADSLIGAYEKDVEQLDHSDVDAMLELASQYNATLASGHIQLCDPFQLDSKSAAAEDYPTLLNINGNGIMGYIDIPQISVYLPVYHGTDPETLEKGIGHLEGSSLPVGGKSTHAVLSGHTGLSRAKMFTDLTELKEGDIFYLYVLDQVLAYEVDQIAVVEPSDTSKLLIEEGEDYVTLVTCTPYGVNTQRLLVRGTRVPYVAPSEAADTSSTSSPSTNSHTSQWMREYLRALVTGIGIVAVLALSTLLIRKWRAKR